MPIHISEYAGENNPTVKEQNTTVVADLLDRFRRLNKDIDIRKGSSSEELAFAEIFDLLIELSGYFAERGFVMSSESQHSDSFDEVFITSSNGAKLSITRIHHFGGELTKLRAQNHYTVDEAVGEALRELEQTYWAIDFMEQATAPTTRDAQRKTSDDIRGAFDQGKRRS